MVVLAIGHRESLWAADGRRAGSPGGRVYRGRATCRPRRAPLGAARAAASPRRRQRPKLQRDLGALLVGAGLRCCGCVLRVTPRGEFPERVSDLRPHSERRHGCWPRIRQVLLR